MKRLPTPEFPKHLEIPLKRLNHAGAVAATDVAVARALTDETTPHEVVEAIVLASIALRTGHTCIDLGDSTLLKSLIARTGDDVAADADGHDPGRDDPDADQAETDDPERAAPVQFPPVDEWAAALCTSDAVEVDTGSPLLFDRPLVFDPVHTRLWFARYARYEARLADALLTRATPGERFAGSDVHLSAVAEVFGDIPSDNPQRVAVAKALSSPVSLITGGPGTGKTWTIARIVEAAERSGLSGTDVIALAAPTGKAAERMTEATGGALRAQTLHRLLRVRPGTLTWDENDSLPHRLVIVDEASMIDLPMMTRLVTSVRPDAHLVLVGDHNQLVSVEVGSVLNDIVEATAEANGPVSDIVTRLVAIRRQAEASPIIALAEAIRTGDADLAIDLLTDASPTVVLASPSDERVLNAVVKDAAAMVEAARSGDASTALARAKVRRVLTATRRGTAGLSGWSGRIRSELGFAPDEWRVGRPVIVTRNDPVNGVANGDTGVVVPAPDEADGVRVAFGFGDDDRLLPATSLRDVEDWWAMTIHKSQGSEYEHVIISLPERDSPIVSRQLLYTAVTRAKASVTIVATEAMVRQAVTRPIARSSGLRDRLVSRRSP